MEGNKLKRWEVLPNDSNRRYRAKHPMVTLKGTESRVEGSEVVEGVKKTKEEPNNSEKKADKLAKKVEISLQKKEMDASLYLDGIISS